MGSILAVFLSVKLLEKFYLKFFRCNLDAEYKSIHKNKIIVYFK